VNIVALDAETYFDKDFTLSKMTTEAYIRDPRFSCHGWGMRWPGGGLTWIDGSNPDWLRTCCDWSNTAVLAHHAHFDGLILSHHYGIKPAHWFDTLSMARLMLGNHVSAGLDSLARHFGLSPKTVPYDLMRGRRWTDMDPATQRQVIDGCLHDLELTWNLFERFMKAGFPREELKVIDLTVRMFTEPKLVGDTALLDKVRDDEALHKNERLYELGVGEKELMSPNKFVALLEAEGVKVVYKEGANGPIPAIAKTDKFMQELLEHPDERISDLALARTEVRSTIDETRAGRLAAMSRRGPLCIYLSYCAAHTRRWGGGDKINAQNLRRGSDLRRGLRAPQGKLFAAVDQSQGECRLLNWFAGQKDVVDRFRRGEDPYVGVASEFYRRPITKADKAERGVGKQLELSCGYGAGAETIVRTAARGQYGPKVILTLEEGVRARNVYRGTHKQVVALWDEATNVLSKLAAGIEFEWGILHGSKGRLYHPNGVWLDYSTLNWHADKETGDRFWRLKTRDGWQKMYGGKLVENCLTGDTKVLTVDGWCAIADLREDELVWDGVEFVEFFRVAHRGCQPVGNIDGVGMTADHLVAGCNGWLRAAQAGGFQRPKVRIPDGYTGRGLDWSEADMVAALRLRQRDHVRFERIAPERFMRLSEVLGFAAAKDAWDVEAPCIRCVQVNAGAVSKPYPSRMDELRRSWDQGVPAVEAELREFLEGHGYNLPDGFIAGAKEQQLRLLQEQLRLGVNLRASVQPPNEPDYIHAVGGDNGCGSSEAFGSWSDHASLQNCQRVGSREVVCSGPTREQVYDLVNCGPRHQFVVLGNTGPMLVHNCIQFLSRVVASQAMLWIAEGGYEVVGMAHDDVWCLIPDDGDPEPHKAALIGVMAATPDWAPGLPLGAECKVGEFYS